MKNLLLAIGCVLLLAGCSNLNTTLFRSERAAVDLVSGGVHTFNQSYAMRTNEPGADLKKLNAQRAAVYGATTNFARVLKVVDATRLAYKANGADTNKAAALIAIQTLGDQSTNVVTLVKSLIGK